MNGNQQENTKDFQIQNEVFLTQTTEQKTERYCRQQNIHFTSISHRIMTQANGHRKAYEQQS